MTRHEQAPNTHRPLLLSIPAASQAIGMSSRWVWEQIKAGELPVVALGRRRMVKVADLEEFVESHTVQARRTP